jgi:apolipoprotein N-acyltransferase
MYLFVFLSVIGTAGLFFCSTGLKGIGFLLFLAPLPVMALADRPSSKLTFVGSFVAYALGALNLVGYQLIFVPVVLIMVTMLVSAAVFGLSVVVTRRAALGSMPWLAVFVFPSMWTAYEFLMSLNPSNGTSRSFAYTQTSFLPLIQIASLTGIAGITFVVTLVPAAAAVMWYNRKARKELLIRIAFAPVALIAFVIIFGFFRLGGTTSGEPVKVSLAVCDTSIGHLDRTDIREALPIAEAYGRRASRLFERNAQIVVLPEEIVGLTQNFDTTIYSLFEKVPGQWGGTLVAGFRKSGISGIVNEAVVFTPHQKPFHYIKTHLVPGFERNLISGGKPLVFRCDSLILGVQICRDMDFPSWSREYGLLDVRILLVPAWDVVADGFVHSRMAVMRGVENGFTVVRCAERGLLTASDCRGRIIAEEPSGPEATLETLVFPGTGRTFYSTAGDWFSWLNILMAGGLLLKIFKHRKENGMQSGNLGR